MSESFFVYRGKHYDYHGSSPSERRVEVPLGAAFLRREGADEKPTEVVEVGNVMRRNVTGLNHLVIDLNEQHPDWENYFNRDVFTWTPPDQVQAALSISTLEHTVDPLKALLRVLSWASRVLVTMPMTIAPHPAMGVSSAFLMEQSYPEDVHVSCLQRIDAENNWREISVDAALQLPPEVREYGSRFPYANLITIWGKGDPP